jgi:charged multivesicular body protein 2A
MNLPAIQRITMEFEWEMDQRNKMIDDVIDAATGLEDEGASEDIVKEVLDGIGIDLSQAVGGPFSADR